MCYIPSCSFHRTVHDPPWFCQVPAKNKIRLSSPYLWNSRDSASLSVEGDGESTCVLGSALQNFVKKRVCVMALSITLSIETPTGRTATTGSTLMFSKWSGHARKITSWKTVSIVFLIPNDVTILLKNSCLHLLSHQCHASQQSHMT